MRYPSFIVLTTCSIIAVLIQSAPALAENVTDDLDYQHVHLENFLKSKEMKKWRNIIDKYPEISSYHPMSRRRQESNKVEDLLVKEEVSGILPKIFHRNACNLDMLYTLLSLKHMWAIQMFDAAGKMPSGVTKGQTNWPGSFDECQEIVAPGSEDFPISGTPTGFKGRYCHFQMSLNALGQEMPIQIGFCVPSSCNETKIAHDKETFDKFIKMIPFVRDWIKKLPHLSQLTCLPSPDEVKYSTGTIYCIGFITLSILIIVSATLYDLYLSKREEPQQHSLPHTVQQNGPSDVSVSPEQNETTDDQATLLQVEPQRGKLVDIWLSFSVFGNATSILDTAEKKGQMNCLHGMRFLSLAWVILGHTYVMAMGSVANAVDILKQFDTFWFQAIAQAPFSVDTFFMLSGFLLTYLFLKDKTRMTWPKWIYFYVHRFIRLTPVYMVLLFVQATWWNYMGDGPFWIYQYRESNLCTQNWWYNLLYINNFQAMGSQCMGWTWYLANDMQFFVISPLFLIPLKSSRYRFVGYIVIGALLLGNWVASGVVTNVHNYPVMFHGLGGDNQAEAVKTIDKEFDILYIKPWMRIGPYVIGALLACLVLNHKEKQMRLHNWVVAVGWMATAALNLIVVYGLYNVNLSTNMNSFYNSMSRSTWALTVAWVIFACLTDNGGPVNTILSWRVWFPLSRLTYCAYLVHPFILYWYFASLRAPYYFTNESTAIYFLGFMMVSYALAFMVSIAFESPVIKIEKILRR